MLAHDIKTKKKHRSFVYWKIQKSSLLCFFQSKNSFSKKQKVLVLIKKNEEKQCSKNRLEDLYNSVGAGWCCSRRDHYYSLPPPLMLLVVLFRCSRVTSTPLVILVWPILGLRMFLFSPVLSQTYKANDLSAFAVIDRFNNND